MKASNILLAILCLALAGCSPNATEPPQENIGPVYLTVDKSIYSPEDTVLVTLHNDSEGPVFLEGCNQLYLATKTDTGWVEGVMWVCVWEGFAVKINPGGVFQRKFMAKHFPGVHKFVAPIYFGCLDGTPISGAKCNRQDKIYSPVFSVSGYENAAGNLEIRTQKLDYTWGPGDLGASRQIEATVFNHSDRTYYARLGDGFNSSLDQETLFAAEGSGGFIERHEAGGNWRAMPRGLLIEGTRFVALRPQRTYRLQAYLGSWRGDETGQFRIKIEYFDLNDPPAGTTPKVDYSNAFTISAGDTQAFEVHLQYHYRGERVRIELDGHTFFNKAVETNYVLSLAEIIKLEMPEGRHQIKVVVNDSEERKTTFELDRKLYVGVRYFRDAVPALNISKGVMIDVSDRPYIYD